MNLFCKVKDETVCEVKEEPLDSMDIFNMNQKIKIEDQEESEKEETWQQPLLTYMEVSLLAVINTNEKKATQEEIGRFVEKHFPFYKYEEQFIGGRIRQGNLLKLFDSVNNTWVYHINKQQTAHFLKKFQMFWRAYPDTTSKLYSMRYPELWEQMVKGEYREGDQKPDCLPSTSSKQEPEDIFLKPPIHERFLLALALNNGPDNFMLAHEAFAFVAYHFPFFASNLKWKYCYRTLTSARGMFSKAHLLKGDKKIPGYHLVTEKGIRILTEWLADFFRTHPDPKFYCMRHPELWNDMLLGKLNTSKDKMNYLKVLPKICVAITKVLKDKMSKVEFTAATTLSTEDFLNEGRIVEKYEQPKKYYERSKRKMENAKKEEKSASRIKLLLLKKLMEDPLVVPKEENDI